MTASEKVVNRAKHIAANLEDNRFDPVTDNLVTRTVDAIADEWPVNHDVTNYRMYLTHDLRDLAKVLNAIATQIEEWDAEAD